MEPDMDIEIGSVEEKPAPLLTRRMLFYAGAVAVVIIALVAVYFTFFGSGKADDAAEAQQVVQQEARQEAEQLVAAVSKLMVLPDEQPIIATVTDPSQLADQPFFQNAKKGDKVLIFNLARKAIMYRPDDNLIVDVAPLTVGSPASPAPKN